MKVAVIGGGGFRTPVVWESIAAVSGEVGVEEVVLHDNGEDRLARVAAVIQGLRREREGDGPPVSTTRSLDEAIDGSGAVFCAIRVGGLQGRVIDETVALASGVLGQETVGPGGIAFALRTVPVMRTIAETVAQRASGAWFLNFTNPAGLITEAIGPVVGERAVGICDSPAGLCARVAAALGAPMRSLRFGYAGLNHMGWLGSALDSDGRDVLPGLLRDDRRLAWIEEGRLFGPVRIRELGAIPNEYLVYFERPDAIAEAFARAGSTRGEILLRQQSAFYREALDTPEAALAAWRRTRDARHGTYMAEAWSATNAQLPDATASSPPDDEGPGEAGYASIAAAFLRAACAGGSATQILNTPNRGRLPFLDDEAVIEAPSEVGNGRIAPAPAGVLGDEQRALVERVKEVERLTIRAATEASARLALEAVVAHPLVPSRLVAERILDGYMAGHAELRERLR